jgi:hypothetical protein
MARERVKVTFLNYFTTVSTGLLPTSSIATISQLYLTEMLGWNVKVKTSTDYAPFNEVVTQIPSNFALSAQNLLLLVVIGSCQSTYFAR